MVDALISCVRMNKMASNILRFFYKNSKREIPLSLCDEFMEFLQSQENINAILALQKLLFIKPYELEYRAYIPIKYTENGKYNQEIRTIFCKSYKITEAGIEYLKLNYKRLAHLRGGKRHIDELTADQLGKLIENEKRISDVLFQEKINYRVSTIYLQRVVETK